MSRVLRFAKWGILPVLALQAFMVLAFRSKFRPIIDGVRAFNKRILNPAMMKLAGRKGWYAAIIRHEGRSSGKEYETPVVAEPTPDGFVIPLPYGEGVDWLRNVLAAGECEIENKGVNYPATEPEVVDREEAAPFVQPRTRRQLDLYGVEKYLKVKRDPAA
ncbi:MAG: hypothetical protein WA982_00780 [Rubrobacteraceae bacterium]